MTPPLRPRQLFDKHFKDLADGFTLGSRRHGKYVSVQGALGAHLLQQNTPDHRFWQHEKSPNTLLWSFTDASGREPNSAYAFNLAASPPRVTPIIRGAPNPAESFDLPRDSTPLVNTMMSKLSDAQTTQRETPPSSTGSTNRTHRLVGAEHTFRYGAAPFPKGTQPVKENTAPANTPPVVPTPPAAVDASLPRKKPRFQPPAPLQTLRNTDPEANAALFRLTSYFRNYQRYWPKPLDQMPSARYEGNTLLFERPTQIDRVSLEGTAMTLRWQSYQPPQAGGEPTLNVDGIIQLNPTKRGTFSRTHSTTANALPLTERMDADFHTLLQLLTQAANQTPGAPS